MRKLLRIEIKGEAARRVQTRLESGAYESVNEVIERALDALEDFEASEADLLRALDEGIAELDRGEGIPAVDVLSELHEKHKQALRPQPE